MLNIFVAGCAIALATAKIQGHPQLAIVWLFSGLIGYAIAIWPSYAFVAHRFDVVGLERERRIDARAGEAREEDAFCHKYLRFSFLMGMTAYLTGYIVSGPVWSNLIVGVLVWFTSMLLVPLLCAPRNVQTEP